MLPSGRKSLTLCDPVVDMRQISRQIEHISVKPCRNRSQRNHGLLSSFWKHSDLSGPSVVHKPRTIFSLLDEKLIEIFTAQFSSAAFVAFYQDEVILVIHVAIRCTKFTLKESVGGDKRKTNRKEKKADRPANSKERLNYFPNAPIPRYNASRK